MASKVCRKTIEDNFVEVAPQKRSAKVARQFLGKFGKILTKILCTPKNLLAPTPMVCSIMTTFPRPAQPAPAPARLQNYRSGRNCSAELSPHLGLSIDGVEVIRGHSSGKWRFYAFAQHFREEKQY